MYTFGQKLKDLRRNAGLTQEALAAKCGMQKQTISRYEKSEREPNIRIAKALADALGVPLESLVPNEVLYSAAEQDNFSEIRGLFRQLTPEEQELFRVQLKAIVQSHKSKDSQ